MLGMEITFASFVAFGEGLAKKEISSLLFSKEWFFPPREIGFEIMLGGDLVAWWCIFSDASFISLLCVTIVFVVVCRLLSVHFTVVCLFVFRHHLSLAPM